MGPIAGGYIAQNIGVKWVFILIAGSSYLFYCRKNIHHLFCYPVLCGLASVVAIPCLRETYAPIIRQRRAAKSGDREKAVYESHNPALAQGKLHYLWVNLSRPIILLFGSFICFVLSLYMALLVIKKLFFFFC